MRWATGCVLCMYYPNASWENSGDKYYPILRYKIRSILIIITIQYLLSSSYTTDAIINVLRVPCHLGHRIILSVCYTGSPHATNEEILRFLSLDQSHRTVGDNAAGCESVSSWLQGACIVYTAIYSNSVLFVIS